MLDRLFTAIDLIDKEIEDHIEAKRLVAERIAEKLNQELCPIIKQELKLDSEVVAAPDYEDPTWIHVLLKVYYNGLYEMGINERLRKEDQIYAQVYELLDKLYSREISNRITVLIYGR